MDPNGNCTDKVRFALSDESGALRFSHFEIVGAPECAGVAVALREYLLGRPLEMLDLDYIRGLACRGNGQCMRDVADAIESSLAVLVADDQEP